MKRCIRTFDVNSRIGIPKVLLQALNIDYENDVVIITLENNAIVIRKLEEKEDDNTGRQSRAKE